ncbi:hypothetical protein B9Z55_029141 [Caenorhabditis nigoni]|uniref:NUDE domain-containing protein n=1 Tax=Caenorhabditis nigoni TaxID=1611254 RepID=A0A2G5S8Y5_9PELO|nr:hypothetical protein B9Z55_029141 [Caenorhabditis nigoni]
MLSDQNASLQSQLKSLQTELESTQQRLQEAESASSWNDDDNWNQTESEDVALRKELEAEISKRNATIEELQRHVERLQKALNEASESADMKALEEMEEMKHQLTMVMEQNNLLKDSEARLMDHADEYAEQMERHRERCVELQVKVTELEEKLRAEQLERKAAARSVEEFSVLRQQLSTAESSLHHTQSQLSNREGTIAELTKKLAEHTKTIEELQMKLKTLAASRRQVTSSQRPSTSSQNPVTPSRPSSRLSTSSRMSTTSSFVPEAVSNPLQTSGSAFDVVVPQNMLKIILKMDEDIGQLQNAVARIREDVVTSSENSEKYSEKTSEEEKNPVAV